MIISFFIRRWKTIRIIIATSLFWILLQSIFLLQNSSQNYQPVQSSDSFSLVQQTSHNSPSQGLLERLVGVMARGVAEVMPAPNLGELGQAVVIPPKLAATAEALFKVHQFNLMASDLMSLNRSLPDYRSAACRSKTYRSLSELPDTSVIIVFHNEAWSTLLRTVHSVLNRSPPELLREIIMVDDASNMDHLKAKLDQYVKRFGQSRSLKAGLQSSNASDLVRVERMHTRSGLIRARLQGARVASGRTLTFLDAHCEATDGWLEPLLDQVAANRRTVACPIIDVISDSNFEYATGSDQTWGGFNWHLTFKWYNVPPREIKRRGGDNSLPLRTPTMAGGLFTIDRDYFYEVGAYDEGMEIWGGENLEMSFRVWMCGGQLLIVTCSRVGHVFRKTSPYSWPGGVAHILSRNNLRTAMVWMDRYSAFYTRSFPQAAASTDFGDVTSRRELRRQLQCRSFDWYLENVYPESLLPRRYFALGAVHLAGSHRCLDTGGRKAGEPVQISACHNQGGNQLWAFTDQLQLRHDELCLDSAGSRAGQPVQLAHCGLAGLPNQRWSFLLQTKQIKHEASGLCLSGPAAGSKNAPSLMECALTQSSVKWTIDNADWTGYT